MKTTSFTVDDISFHTITIPSGTPCQKMTIREIATDIAPVAYLVAGPASADTEFPKFPGESTEFRSSGPYTNASFQGGETVGWIKSSSGTITFSAICE